MIEVGREEFVKRFRKENNVRVFGDIGEKIYKKIIEEIPQGIILVDAVKWEALKQRFGNILHREIDELKYAEMKNPKLSLGKKPNYWFCRHRDLLLELEDLERMVSEE